MTCPDCGYMMTAFDAKCVRCAKIGKPQQSPAEILPTLAFFDNQPGAGGDTTTGEKPKDVTGAEHIQSEPPKPKLRWIFLAVAAASLLAIAVLYLHTNQVKVDALKVDALKMDTLKNEGFGQCTAGDVEGCHYYIDKLRDQGDAADGEYLKARMIAAEYFNSSPALATMSLEFTRNEVTAQTLKAMATLAAVEGNRSAMDACGFLGDHPPPPGFPRLPPDVASTPSAIKTETANVAPAQSSPVPAYSMTTKAGGGAPPDTSVFK